MRPGLLLLAVTLTLALLGCGKSGSQSGAGFEGNYVQVDRPDISLVIKGDSWRQGSSDIAMDCTFTAQKTGEASWRVEQTFKGEKSVMLVRKEGEFLLVKEDQDNLTNWTKFKRE
jgi:hypothetical protein